MKQKEMEPRESLEFISRMIRQTRSNYTKEGSFQILLWGWVVAIANFGHAALAFAEYPQAYVVWLITIPAAIVSAIYNIRRRKNSMVKGHLDHIYGMIWLAVGIGILILLAHMVQINYFHNAIILILAATGTFITGQLLRFKPIILGAAALWVAAIVTFYLPVPYQYLLGGVAIVIGYLIPGYLLKKAEV